MFGWREHNPFDYSKSQEEISTKFSVVVAKVRVPVLTLQDQWMTTAQDEATVLSPRHAF